MFDRLSPIESIIWRVGCDPDLRMTIGNLMVLDHAPSVTDLTNRLTALSKDVPQLRPGPRSRSSRDDVSGGPRTLISTPAFTCGGQQYRNRASFVMSWTCWA